MNEPFLSGIKNRLLQLFAQYLPGATTVRPSLHRLRGVTVGEGVFIGAEALIETSQPHLVSIGDGVAIGIRSVIIAHFRPFSDGDAPRTTPSVVIEDEAFIGPGVIILPNVKIGYGAVVTAGSVVARSVPKLTMVQGNPAVPVARCGLPLGMETPLKEFYRALTPIRQRRGADGS